MVSIVTGNGLGLTGSSANVLGSGGQLHLNIGGVGDAAYINAKTGNLILQRQDELLIGRGPDIGILRTYNSQGAFDFDNSDNWQLSLYRQLSGLTGTLNAVGSTITRTGADGAQLIYTYHAASGQYRNTDGGGSYDTLTYSNNTWTWQDGDNRVTETYEASGSTWRIKTIADPDGNALTYTYANGLITEVADANGETTRLVYVGTQLQRIEIVSGSNTLSTRTRYEYDSQGRLKTVITDLSPEDSNITDGNVYITSYTYDGTSNRIASITNGGVAGSGNGTTVSFTYHADGKVKTVADGLGNSTEFTYIAGAGFMIVRNANGETTYAMEYDTKGQLFALHSPDGAYTYTYNANGDVMRVIDARGNATDYLYDANGNRIREQDTAGNVIERTYSNQNQLLTETRYAVADPDGTGPATASVPQTTRYIYSADNKHHLRFIISAEGRVTEYRYDGFGQQTSQIQYAANTYTATGTQTEANLAAWLSGVNKAQSQRIDYTYDARGALKSRSLYGSVDNAGNGVNDASKATTYYTYDQAGNLRQVIDGRGTETGSTYLTSYAYDGANRLVSQTDALGSTTTTVYNDASRQVTIQLANGLQTIHTYDQAGRLISTAQKNGNTNTALGTTTYAYDNLGQLRQVTDPIGRSTYTLYDTAGRKVGEIDGEQSLTEFIYNPNGQLIATRRYANLVTASLANATTLTLEGVKPAAHANDRITHRLYDQAGRLAKEIDGTGAVTAYTYDGASRLLTTTQYTKLLTQAQQDALITDLNNGLEIQANNANTVPVADSANDRVTRRLYDNDGLLVGVLDGEGYLTEYRYDQAGRQTQTIRYATQSPSAQWVTGTLTQLRPAANATKDQATHRLYNAQGQLVGEVDAESYLTEYAYDLAGNTRGRIRYASKVTYAVGNTLEQTRPAAHPEDLVTATVYDANNRLQSTQEKTLSQHAMQGLMTVYTRDNVGNLLSTIALDFANFPPSDRTQSQRYDLQGRLIAELNGEGSKALLALSGTPTQAQIDNIWNTYGIRYEYDAAGQRIATITPNGTNASGLRTRHYYDNDGRLTHSINALGEVTEYRYNAFDEIVAERRYNSRIATAVLGTLMGGKTSSLGTAVSSLAGGYSELKTGYDKSGRAISHTDALGNTNPLDYNAFGELRTEVTRINSSTTTWASYTYDRRGVLKSNSNELGLNTTRILDAFGRVTQVTDARNNTTKYDYDRLGRQITFIDGTNITSRTTYDAHDRVLTKVDGRGQTTTYTYNSAARTMVMTTAEGVQVTTTTNGFGETVSIQDGRGNTTTYAYDADGRLLKTIDPIATNTNTYDKAGRLVMTQDGRGTNTQYTYDAANRVLTQVINPGAGNLNLTTTYRYDAQGRKTWEQDATGTWTRTDFDAKGQVTSIVVDPKRGPNWVSGADDNPAGLSLETRFSYDARGKTQIVTEGYGTPSATKTVYLYDKLGRRTQEVIDADGLALKTTYTYSGTGYVLSKTDAAGNVTRYTYDGNNRVIHTVDAMGYVTTNAYDATGNLVKVTQHATAIDLTDLAVGIPPTTVTARLITSANDRVTQSVYDRDNRLIFTVDANGYVTRNEYDTAGNVVKRTQYANKMQGTLAANARIELLASGTGTGAYVLLNSLQDRVEQTVYDALNRATLTIDAEGYVTAYLYTANGGLYQTTRYANPVERRAGLTANVAPPIVSSVPANGPYVLASAQDQLTQMAYDAAHRPIFRWDAERNVTQFIYDGNGRVIQEIRYANKLEGSLAVYPGRPSVIAADATAPTSGVYVRRNATEDRTTQYSYDGAGRLKDSINAQGETTRHTYDETGNLITKTVAFGTSAAVTTRYVYDNAGRLTDETRADGTAEAITTHYEHDALGNQLRIFEAYGTADQRLTQQQFDLLGRKTRAIDALGNTISTDYNAFGDIVKLIDANGNAGYFYTDKLGRVTLQINPDGAVTTYSYNAFGQQTQVARLANRYTGALSTTVTPNVTYSANDQLQGSAYNRLGQVTATTTWWGGIGSSDYYNDSYTYDAFGNVKTATARNGATTSYAYDKLNRKVSETLPVTSKQPNGTSLPVVNTYAYDAAGNLVTKTEAQGLAEQRITTYTYDKHNRLLSEAGEPFQSYNPVTDSTVSVIPTKRQAYDARGNLVKETDANGNVTWHTYDLNNQRTGTIAADGSYTRYSYDKTGNRISEIRYANAVKTSGTAQIAVGVIPVLLTTAPAANSNTVYVLLDATQDRTVHFTYDKVGRETGSKIDNITTGQYDGSYVISLSSIETRKAYDANGNLIKSVDANDNITRYYYNTAGEQVAKVDALGYLTTWVRDAFGNVTKETQYAQSLESGTSPLDVNDSTTLAAIQAKAATLDGNADNRITERTYDALNRVKTESRLNVQAGTIDTTTGIVTQAATPDHATTTYEYDGLNHVTKKTDATGAITSWVYDNLGRRTSQINPGFVDYQNTYVNPRTDLEYDGLNNIVREIVRGKNDNIETDDHIT
ncbi:hypothetical protein ACW4YW_15525, partial [Methylobacillus pratensis]